MISGAAGLRESAEQGLLPHRIRASAPRERLFKEVCAQTACLDASHTAVDQILRVLDALCRESRPGDLKLPRDSLTRPVPRPLPPLTPPTGTGWPLSSTARAWPPEADGQPAGAGGGRR